MNTKCNRLLVTLHVHEQHSSGVASVHVHHSSGAASAHEHHLNGVASVHGQHLSGVASVHGQHWSGVASVHVHGHGRLCCLLPMLFSASSPAGGEGAACTSATEPKHCHLALPHLLLTFFLKIFRFFSFQKVVRNIDEWNKVVEAIGQHTVTNSSSSMCSSASIAQTESITVDLSMLTLQAPQKKRQAPP